MFHGIILFSKLISHFHMCSRQNQDIVFCTDPDYIQIMDIKETQTHIFEAGLKNVPFDGWTLQAFEQAAETEGTDKALVMAVFPRGEMDILDFYAQWADDKMMMALADVHPDDLKIRARVRMAVEKRIEILTPHKEATRMAFKKLLMPNFARTGAKMTWRTADVIWNWAGDESTDYNRYTKRGLLSGVIATTMTYWLQNNDEDNQKTYDFLSARIENVLFIGKNTSKIVKPLEGIVKNFIVPNIKSKMDKA